MSKPIPFDERKHDLVGMLLHKALLPPQELDALIIQAEYAGIKIIDVQMPEWPPLEVPPLAIMMGGGNGNPFSGSFFKGVQPAVDLFVDGFKVRDMARKMRGSTMSEEAISYQFQLPIFNPKTHVRIRKYIEDNLLSIVDFWRSYFPKIEYTLDKDSIITVVNPDVENVDEDDTQFYPTTRVIKISESYILDKFKTKYPPLSFNLTQTVSWIRSLDDKKYEARRQYAPQNKTWKGKNCFITRTVGGGQHSSLDVDPKTGYSWGPFMILKDDGKIVVWVTKFAVQLIERSGLRINGVVVQFKRKSGMYINRMVGNVTESQRLQILKLKVKDEEIVLILKDETVKEDTNNSQISVTNDVNQNSVTERAKVYSPSVVLQALEDSISELNIDDDRDFALFGGQTSDKKIIALTKEGAELFLAKNKVNRNKYINDSGGRNFDCDNFAEQLRADLQKEYGINGIGIIWGDVHAWNFFVIASTTRPRIIMIEPQTDEVIFTLNGKYAINTRCSVIL